jgi:flagellar biosynthetic protein FliR
MVTVSSAQLLAWIAAFLWPFTRIMGMIAVAPLFGNVAVPAPLKVLLGVTLSMLVAPGLSGLPQLDPMSGPALFILFQQFIIGAAMGFVVRVVFAAVEMAGEITGMTMGLGFATFFDPQSQGRSSAISQFLALVVLLFYLATNLHLVLISAVIDSFQTIPIALTPMSGGFHRAMVEWGGHIFSAGVQLSLPMVAVLLITNIALGVLTRAAPQLNIFGVGFPITISVGLVMLALVLPYLAVPMEKLFGEAFGFLGRMR